MTTNTIIAIELIASASALIYGLKRPLAIPLFFLFLNILFSSQYIGRFNIPTIAFLFPSLIISLFIQIQNKTFTFIKSNLKTYFIFIISIIAISIIHFLIWNQLPNHLLKVSILAHCFLPLLFRDLEDFKENDFIKTGAFLFVLATFLLLPQAVKFYHHTQGQGLGRQISGGLALDHYAAKTWAVLPTGIKGHETFASLFSIREKATYYYLTLSSMFFAYLFLYFFITPLRITFFLIASFLLVYVSEYINVMMSFHLQLSVATILVYYFHKKKINRRKNLSTFILLIVLNISTLFVTLTSNSFINKIISTSYSIEDQTKARDAEANSDSKKKNFLLINALYQIPGGRDKSRLSRIKDSARLLVQEYPLIGIGDPSRKGLQKRDKNGTDKFSAHSFILDTFVSLGLILGIIFLFVPYLYAPLTIIRKWRSLGLPIISFTALLTSSLINSSFLGVFGIQPFHLGFLLFTTALIRQKSQIKVNQNS